MLVGHFAAALIGKRIAPKTSLGTLVLAALLPDVLWGAFLLAGVEHVEIKPGKGAANYLASAIVPLSHSLLMDAVWGGLFAVAYFFRKRYPRGAWVIFGVTLSHWFLDFLSNGWMPLAPGVPWTGGLELWRSVLATLVAEGGLWLLGIIVYARATHATTRTGVYAFWAVIAFLTLAWINNITGPPPPNATAMAISSLVFFLLSVAWAHGMNRARPPDALN
jgi:multisubunit Na+/H+ antiporter MnhG subunit